MTPAINVTRFIIKMTENKQVEKNQKIPKKLKNF